MKTDLARTLRSRGVILGLHGVFWVMLYAALVGLGGKSPPFRENLAGSAPPLSPAPVAKLDRLLAPQQWPKSLSDSNALPAFFTRHFIPLPTPTPPPPTTKKIELTYLGFFETTGGRRTTIVKLGDAFLVKQVGSKVTANLFAAEASILVLTLTNSAAQTNILQLNIKKEVEVPIE
jgi:hypothetical protein